MSDYLAALTPSAPLSLDDVRRLELKACLDLHRVSWLRCYVASAGTRALSWYRAPDAETVRLVLRQQGFAGAVVTPVELAGTSDPETLLEPEDGIVLELDTELAPAVDAACSDLDADALRIFTGRHGGKRIVAIEGREAAARADRLSAADVAAATSWR